MMPATKPVRILLMEDDVVAARLLQKRLERAGYVVDHAKNSEEGLAKFSSGSYDILTVDYSLPGRNGLEVIRILGSERVFPPIIMVAGSGDERIAVEAMKLGAKDYIVKDAEGRYLDLLPRVVEQILSERNLIQEKRQTIDALSETQVRYRDFFENAPLGFYRTTPEGQFLDANPAFIAMMGLPNRETLLEMNALEIYRHPVDRSRWKDLIRRQKIVNNFEVEVVCYDGSTMWIEDNSRAIRDKKGNILYYEGSVQNINERRRTEEELRRLLVANAAMAELSRALLSPGSIEDISNLVLEKARSLTGSTFGFVGYIDPHTKHQICAAITEDIWDKCEVPDKESLFKKTNGLWGWVFNSKRPLLTNSPSEDPRSAGLPEGHASIKRFLAAPALIGDQLVGQVAVANSGRNYTELDSIIVERLASTYAIALDRKWLDEAIVKARDFYLTLFDDFPALIWRSGLDARCDYFNITWLKFTGRSIQQELGDGWSEGVHAEDLTRSLHAYLKAFKTRKPFEMEFRLRRHDGIYRWVIDIGRPFFDLDGKFAGYIGSCFDITEQKEIQSKLRHLSHHDVLTQLYNRAFFEEELARAERGRNFPVTVLMVDVDELKKVNDTFGHAEGDKLLMRTADVLRATFRPEDVVARIGGDEFAIILPGVDVAVAQEILQRLKDRLEAHNQSHPYRPLSLSVGMATAEKGIPLAKLLKEADEKMYEAKITKASSSLRKDS